MIEKLYIIQYNLQKNLNVVMAPILADKQVTKFSVLAVPEPYQNSFISLTHSVSYSTSYLLHSFVLNSCVYYFINKSMNSSYWTGDFPSPDYSSLPLRSPVNSARDVVIYSIYRLIGSKSAIASFFD